MIWVIHIFIQDFSLLVNDCSDKENQFDSYNPLNIAQTVTPAKLSGKPSDEVRLIYLPQINLQDYDDVFDTTTDKLGIPMVTPIITITDETDAVSKVITSTPMFGFTADRSIPKRIYHCGIHNKNDHLHVHIQWIDLSMVIKSFLFPFRILQKQGMFKKLLFL